MPPPLTQINPFELDGVWWEAGEDPEQTGVYGTLTFEPEAGLNLRLLRPGRDPFSDQAETFVVHGRALNATPCTLLDAFIKKAQSWWPAGHEKIEIKANLLVHGALVEARDELLFQRAQLTFSGLREFLAEGAVTDDGFQPGLGAGSDGDLAERTVSIDGAELSFRIAWSSSVSRHRHVREQEASVLLKLDEPATFDAWLERFVKPLQHLITFATREPSRLESFVAIMRDEGAAESIHPAIRRAGSDAMWERRLVEFVSPPTTLVEARPRFRYERLLFSLAALADDADRFIDRWFEMHAALRGPSDTGLSGAADSFFAALSSRMYLENRLLNVMSAAESYHRTFHDDPPLTEERHKKLKRRMLDSLDTAAEKTVYEHPLKHANSQNQRARLRWLCNRAGDVISELHPLCGSTVAELVATRNYYTHLDEATGDEREGFELLELVERLVMVLQLNFLLDLGVDASDVEGWVRRSYEGQTVFQARGGG